MSESELRTSNRRLLHFLERRWNATPLGSRETEWKHRDGRPRAVAGTESVLVFKNVHTAQRIFIPFCLRHAQVRAASRRTRFGAMATRHTNKPAPTIPTDRTPLSGAAAPRFHPVALRIPATPAPAVSSRQPTATAGPA